MLDDDIKRLRSRRKKDNICKRLIQAVAVLGIIGILLLYLFREV